MHSTGRLVARLVTARAQAYRALDEFRRQLRTRGIRPDSVISVEPISRLPSGPPPKTISAKDPDWLTFLNSWKAYDKLNRKWEATKADAEKIYLAWHQGRRDELERKFGRRPYFDTSVDEAGHPNNPQDYSRAAEYSKEWELFNREDKKRLAQVTLPETEVPVGWKGRRPFYKIETLNDVEPWLERALRHARALGSLNVQLALDHCGETVLNLMLLARELGIVDRPNLPISLLTLEDLELAFDQLLLWVQNTLAADVQAETTLVIHAARASSESGPTRNHESAEREKPDGPHPPNEFSWKGRRAELQPIPWKLVNFLWHAEKQTAEIETVVEAVWGNDSQRGDSALKSAINRANNTLLEKEIPITVSKKSGYVSLFIKSA
jgi:hypothetical protein